MPAGGNFANGDYFFNCDSISLDALRAIFGVWINVCVATIAICVRSTFRFRIKNNLLSGQRQVSLWRSSPPVTISEVFELRGVLLRAIIQSDFPFVFASTFCILTTLVGAASTLISNYAVVNNLVIRDVAIDGRNVTHMHNSIEAALLQVATRTKALERANAPLDELFDFVPDDDSHWIYTPSQWNNTWKGHCMSTKHDAVDLVVYPTNSSYYQDEVPLLGNYIPSWATLNHTKQGVFCPGFYESNNDTSSYVDLLPTYVFGTAEDNATGFTAKTSNIAIVNYLAHHVERYLNGSFVETRLKSDVHVVECAFVNSVENGTKYQAKAAGGSYANAAQNIAQMYNRAVVDNSTARRPVIEPTGMEMLRYWQAYMSVKDAQYPNPDVRILSAVRDVVQIRLSALVTSITAFLFAVVIAGTAKYRAVKTKANTIHLPSSQLDWMVQAAREHTRSLSKYEKGAFQVRNTKSPNQFAIDNKDDFFIVSPDFELRIATARDLSKSVGEEAVSTNLTSASEEEAFDPWAAYTETREKV